MFHSIRWTPGLIFLFQYEELRGNPRTHTVPCDYVSQLTEISLAKRWNRHSTGFHIWNIFLSAGINSGIRMAHWILPVLLLSTGALANPYFWVIISHFVFCFLLVCELRIQLGLLPRSENTFLNNAGHYHVCQGKHKICADVEWIFKSCGC